MKPSTLDRIFAGFLVAMSVCLIVLTFTLVANAQDVCPETGKIESVVDGDIDGIVLEAGTEVCIKGGQVLVVVTADGVSTLAELLGTGQNVSHYTVLEVPSSTTTSTTTSIPTTTSTLPEATTIPSTTSSIEAPTSTQVTTTVPVTTTAREELPFTGIPSLPLAGAALSMLLTGGLILRSGRES